MSARHCRVLDAVTPQMLEQIGFSPDEARVVQPVKGTGCDKCNRTGYKGRVGLYEVMEITDDLRELILVGASSLELRRKAIDSGHDHAARQRPPENQRRRHLGRRGVARNGAVTGFARTPCRLCPSC